MNETADVEHHTAVLNGIRQHWVSAGDGPPVYLLHGFPETWFGWRKQIAVLAEHHTVVAPDLRGYGATDKPASGYDKRTMAADVVALMDHLGHPRAAVVGHDRGARVATRLVKDHPDRVDASPHWTTSPPGSWPPSSAGSWCRTAGSSPSSASPTCLRPSSPAARRPG
ncbi:MAG: alpha/beta fold hydrolase [Janthinobacterium lividum]